MDWLSILHSCVTPGKTYYPLIIDQRHREAGHPGRIWFCEWRFYRLKWGRHGLKSPLLWFLQTILAWPQTQGAASAFQRIVTILGHPHLHGIPWYLNVIFSYLFRVFLFRRVSKWTQFTRSLPPNVFASTVNFWPCRLFEAVAKVLAHLDGPPNRPVVKFQGISRTTSMLQKFIWLLLKTRNPAICINIEMWLQWRENKPPAARGEDRLPFE